MNDEVWFGVRYLKVLCAHPTLSPRGRLIGAVLARHSDNETGECFLSLDTLEQETGLARHTILAGLRDLEEAELLSTERGGPRRSNTYRPLLPPEEGRHHCTEGASPLHLSSAVTALELPPELPPVTTPREKQNRPLTYRDLLRVAKRRGMTEAQLWALIEETADMIEARSGLRYTDPLSEEYLPAVFAAVELWEPEVAA